MSACLCGFPTAVRTEMFCCLSPTPTRTLNPRDLKMVRAFAEMAVFDIERDLRASAKSDRDGALSPTFCPAPA